MLDYYWSICIIYKVYDKILIITEKYNSKITFYLTANCKEAKLLAMRGNQIIRRKYDFLRRERYD